MNSTIHSTPLEYAPQIQAECFHVALAGQPNMGKSTIFNALTGLNQHVGNWPGKTVEKKEGRFNFDGHDFLLIDLPGTYSLTSNSPEEVITREYILQENPDLVIAVVNAANLERSLYLLSELVTLNPKLVVALNMMDVAVQENIHINPQELERALNIPVVPMVATHIDSIKDLIRTTIAAARDDRPARPNHPVLPENIQRTIDLLSSLLATDRPSMYPPGWVEMKLLEGDGELTEMIKSSNPPQVWDKVEAVLAQNEDALLAIVSNRYEWISKMIHSSVSYIKTGQIGLTEKLDRVAAHPFWGLFSLAAILGFVFWLTFSIGTPLQEWIDNALISPVYDFSAGLLQNAPAWVQGLLLNGLIGGVGSVLTFLPILVIFFGTFGFLEDVGYMARAAYVMDNLMHLMGLHGKSFLPLFLGFGCNVPSILGTRVIDTREARLLTILIAPFIPCTARMAVVAFIAPAFFGSNATFVSWGLIFGSILILMVLGVVLNRTIFAGKRSAFIMEMPLYHIPNLRTIGLLVWQRSMSFIKKAGTLILMVSVLIWILSYLPNGDFQNSYLSRFGQILEPMGRWMGLDWKLTLALFSSFLAKENSIATLGVLFGTASETSLPMTLASNYSPATALAFLTVSILFIPCAATVAVIKQETNSWKWTGLNLVMMLIISIVAAIAVYQVSMRLGL